MKKILSVLFVTIFLFASCGYKKAAEEARESLKEAAEEMGVETDFEEAKNCDEFIDQYEKWMDSYLEFLEEYLKNPMDAVNSQEYAKLAMEGANWASQWGTKWIKCASKDKYQKRFDEISEKAEKKMKELGLD